MSEAVELFAEVIEPASELRVTCSPAVIEDNLAALEAYVDAQVAPYVGAVIDPADEEQVKEGRRCMADLNRLKAPIEEERKRVKRAYEAPLKAFEARVKGITAKIDAARSGLKAQVDEADERFRAMRRELLAEEYGGCAGALASVIPFSAVLDEGWLNRSVAEPKALALVQEAAERALEGYQALMAAEMPRKDEVVARYAETLDVAAALRHGAELAERDRRMAEFRAAQEEAARVAAGRAPEPEPAPRPGPAADPAFVWSLTMEFEGTRDDAQRVADALRAEGVTGASIRCKGEVRHG